MIFYKPSLGHVHIPEELYETPAGHHDPLVLVGLVLGQVPQQLLGHGQGGPGTQLPVHHHNIYYMRFEV